MDIRTRRGLGSRPMWRMSMAVAAVALGATACGGGSGPSTASGSSSPVKVGFFAPESGFAAADGASSHDAATLAVEYINAHGGLGGHQVTLVNYDDASDPKQAVSIATRLVTQDRVTAVVSGSYSDQTLAAAPIFQRNKVPMVASYAVNPGIPSTGDYIFQQDFSGDVQGAAGAATAQKAGAKKIAIVAVDNDFGHALVKGFQDRAGKAGLQVVATDFNQFGEKDFTPVLSRDIGKGADGFYMVQYAAEGQQFIQDWNAKGLKLPLIGTEGIDTTTEFLKPMAKAADGLIFTTALDRDSTDKVTTDFIQTFTQRFNHAPDMVAATTYDAFLVLQQGAKSGTTAQKIRDGISGITDYKGVTGTIAKYTSEGTVVKPVDVEIIKGGEVHHYATIDDPSIIQP